MDWCFVSKQDQIALGLSVKADNNVWTARICQFVEEKRQASFLN